MNSEVGSALAGPVSQVEIESLARRVSLSAMDGRRVLVTGSQGLIGNYLAQALSEAMRLQGVAPSALILQARRPKCKRQGWASKFHFIEHLHLSLDYAEVFPEVDTVIHAASPASPIKYSSPSDIYTPNISGILSTLALTPLPERVLFISSGEVYGVHDNLRNSSDVEPRFRASGPRASYPNAKLAAEKLLLSARTATSDFRIARLFHTFGPGLDENDGRSFADFLYNAAKGQPVKLYSDGNEVRNFAYIEDSVAALLMILASKSNDQIFDVSGPHRVSIRRFAELIAELSGVGIHLSDSSAQKGRIPMGGLPPSPSTQPLTSIGWHAEISLEEGVSRTLDHIRTSFRVGLP
jgi:dTDP-glucose 4,6-dehydratase